MSIQRRIRAPRATLAASLVSAAILAILVALPTPGSSLAGNPATTAWHGRITAILDPHRPDPTGVGGGFLPDARVLLMDGPHAGEEVEAYRQGPGGQQDSNAYRVDEEVVVTSTGNPDGSAFLAIADRWRLPQLVALTGMFAAAVILIGGWRGLRALLGLAMTVAILLKVLVPLLVAGAPPIPVAVVVATVLTLLAIGLTEGRSRAGVAAILGTASALALTAILAALFTAAAGFTNTLGSELVGLTLPDGEGLDLRGILLAAFMVGSIGVLDDVTVTQAIAVDELAAAGLRGRDLYRSAFGIGRAHLAATVNTLFLAYAGASLPLLIVLAVGNLPPALLVNGESIAIEIVRTMVGSLGIVAAVPLTTLIAAWLVAGDRPDKAAAAEAPTGPDPGAARGRPSPTVALAFGLGALALVTLVAALTLGPLVSSRPRIPVAPDQFGEGPAASTASAVPSTAIGSADPGPGSVDGPILAAGEPIPLFSPTGERVGTVTIGTVEPRAGDEGGLVLDVEFRYEALRPLAIDPGAWVAHTPSGDQAVGATSTDRGARPPLPAELGASGVVAGWVTFTLPGIPGSVWLDYEPEGSSLFTVPLY